MVTIIIPTYKGIEKLFAYALPSIYAQTYKKYKIIIVNDGYDNEMKEKIKKLNDPKITYHELERIEYGSEKHQWCVGGAASRNFALDLVDGELIAPLDQDDMWGPDFLLSRVMYFKKNPHIDFIYSQAQIIGSNKKTYLAGTGITNYIRDMYKKNGSYNVIPHCTVIYRAKLNKYTYPTHQASPADRGLWSKMFKDNVSMIFFDKVQALHYGKDNSPEMMYYFYKEIFKVQVKRI